MPDESPHSPAVFSRWLLAAWALCIFATQASAHGAYHDLLTAIDGELATNPDSPERWFKRAEINLSHREWMLAMLDLKQVETLAPDQFPTRWLKGQALDQGGKFGPAKVELDAFILANPKHAGALASRGRVLRALGKIPEALADFRAALLINPDVSPELVIEIADAMAGSDAADEAAMLLDSSLKRHGDDTAVLLKALEVDQQAKRWDSAIQRVDSLLKSAPRPEPWLAKRAALLAMAGRPSEARAAWQALKDHLASLPNLERGNPAMIQLAKEADTALTDLPVVTGGDFGEELELAITDYRVVMENQTSPGPALYLEVIDCLRSADQLSEASALAGSSIGRFGGDPSLLSKALEIDVARRDFASALLRVAALEKISPRPEPWMAERARILAAAGRAVESHAAWTAVRDRISAMPNLERGNPELSAIAKEAERHLAPPISNTDFHQPVSTP